MPNGDSSATGFLVGDGGRLRGFCRYFRRQTNMTFTEFVNQYRIERAQNLLMQNNNVSETCYAVGIDSLSYFNKLFKEIAGENPSDFRRDGVEQT